MKTLVLYRVVQTDKYTGSIMVLDGKEIAGVAIELPWRNNEVGKSCIPHGNYEMRWCAKKGGCFAIDGVKGRSGILMHSGNYASDSRGCILPGRWFQNSASAGEHMVCNSVWTLGELHKNIGDEPCLLKIIEEF